MRATPSPRPTDETYKTISSDNHSMVPQKEGSSVVVVGGGVTGTASAYMLAEDHDVTVIDKGMIAGDTTARASGFLATPPTFPNALG